MAGNGVSLDAALHGSKTEGASNKNSYTSYDSSEWLQKQWKKGKTIYDIPQVNITGGGANIQNSFETKF